MLIITSQNACDFCLPNSCRGVQTFQRGNLHVDQCRLVFQDRLKCYRNAFDTLARRQEVGRVSPPYSISQLFEKAGNLALWRNKVPGFRATAKDEETILGARVEQWRFVVR